MTVQGSVASRRPEEEPGRGPRNLTAPLLSQMQTHSRQTSPPTLQREEVVAEAAREEEAVAAKEEAATATRLGK